MFLLRNRKLLKIIQYKKMNGSQAIPQCRRRASGFGSRPRNIRYTSEGCLEPPSDRTVSRKPRPISRIFVSFSRPASSKAPKASAESISAYLLLRWCQLQQTFVTRKKLRPHALVTIVSSAISSCKNVRERTHKAVVGMRSNG